MKKIVMLILMLMVSVLSFSQTINPPSPVVGVGYGVEKGQTITVDSLNFRDGQTLLMQDNSTLIIRYKVTGAGRIEYGDVGDDIPNDQQVEIPRTLGSYSWLDHRDPTDVNGKVVFLECQDPDEFQLTFGDYVDYEYFLEPTLTLDVPSTLLSCNTESITLTANSSDPNVSYLWSNGLTSQSITVNAAGTYSVTVTNSNGCDVVSDDVVITQDINVPIADAGGPASINCIVNQVTIGTESTQTDVSYLWSNGEITPQITVTEAGNYTLTVTNEITGCESSDVSVVTLDTDSPIVDVISDFPSLSCGVETITITANVAGNSSYSYLWDSGETTNQISITQPGIYGVNVLDALSGCETYQNIIIDDITQPVVATDSGDVEICAGETVLLTAYGGKTYEWINTGETTQEISVSPTSTTVYTYNVYDGTCVDQGTVTVTVYQQPIATLDSDMEIFVGEIRTLTAGGGSEFLWSTGETTSTINVQPSVTTTYTVTVSNGTCSDTKSVTITVVEPPEVIANAGNDVVICNGDNVILSVPPTSNGTYLWSNGMTSSSITVAPSVHTVYSVTITANGKSDTDYVLVRVNQCN